ncbi:MAG: hypothetical protein GAK45_00065 [Pseudomonas citronellolis]|nr:MAG: hypothetical protein GAK45_00065 [Pseudomonas citronellolis]
MKSPTLALLLCLSTPAFATEVTPATFTTSEFKAHLRSETSALLAEHTQRANECAERGMHSTLSDKTIQGIDALKLDKDQATAALLYLALQAQEACVGGTLAFQTISHLRYARSLNIEGFGEEQMNALLFDSEHAIRAQYVYSQIPATQREALERMDELRSPFSITGVSRLSSPE